jgi:hypothetical protein
MAPGRSPSTFSRRQLLRSSLMGATVLPLALRPVPSAKLLALAGAPPREITNEALRQGMFAAIPAQAAWAGIQRTTLDPGAEWALGTRDDSGEGPMLYRVEAGELTIDAAAMITLTRAGGHHPSAIEPGEAVLLQAGDQGFTPSGVPSRWRNAGRVPTVALTAAITTLGRCGPLPPGVHQRDIGAEGLLKAPTPPVQIAVRRVTLPPSVELPVDTVPGLALVAIEAGQLAVIDRTPPANPLATQIPHDVRWIGNGSLELRLFPPGRAYRSHGPGPVTPHHVHTRGGRAGR